MMTLSYSDMEMLLGNPFIMVRKSYILFCTKDHYLSKGTDKSYSFDTKKEPDTQFRFFFHLGFYINF